MAVLAIAAVGAAVGGAVASSVAIAGLTVAMGAQIGWLVGSLVGNMLFSPKPPQPKIGDIRIQNSAYGQVIPRVYGMFRIAGNVMWAGQPHQHSSGGKGGKGGGQVTVNMSFAIGLCEGPIQGVRRIWANGKLIYDISNPSNFEAISGSNQMVTNFKVYNGDETQLPDPTMESNLGVGNVPAHRGLAYVVLNELDLSTWGNFLPSFSFEVVTDIAPVYSGVTMSTYTQTPSQDMGEINGLSPQAATFMSLGYLHNYSGLYVGQLTPYGSSFTNPYGESAKPTPTNAPQWAASAYSTWADEPGMLCPDSVYGVWGWYKPDGTVMLGAAGLPSWVAGTGRNYVKKGVWLYATCSVAGPDWRIVKCSLMPTDPDGNALAGRTGQIVAYTDPIYCAKLLGVSDSYLYAVSEEAGATRGTIYQFDENTLALVNSWPGSSLDNSWLGFTSAGHVIDDRNIYTYGAGRLYVFDAVSGVLTRLGTGLSPSATTMQVVTPGFILLGDAPSNSSATLSYLQLSFPATAATVPLSVIVGDICARAGLDASQYDVSQLTDPVWGYAVTTMASARDNLVPLMNAYFFDVTNSDGKLKFVKRGGATAGTFAYADLGAANSIGDEGNENPIQILLAQEIDLPSTLSLTYVGNNTDYQQSTQTAFRTATRSNKNTALSVPIAMSDDEGLQKAQTMLWNAWLAHEQFTFSTTLAYLKYEPNDVVTLQGASASYPVRLTECQYDAQGVLRWTALSERSGIFTSTAVGGPPAGFPVQQIDYNGPTALAVLDVPPLRDQDTSPGLYLAACGFASSWPGCTVEISRDGSSFTNLVGITTAAVIGVAQTALANFSGGNQPDELSTVTVVVDSGTLAAVTYANFLAGTNAALIGDEIVFFRNATLTAANTYQLSGFVRGVAGTDWAMSTHAVGERFVLLSASSLSPVSINTGDIGSKLYFETRLLNLFASQPSPVQSLTPANARMQPLRPAMFRALNGSASSTSDISLFWTRRARVYAGWLNGTDVPLDQASESYQLTISNASGVVKRTVTVSAAQTYVYSAANISADGFTTGNIVNFSVSQNSDLGIAGRAATASIVR